MLEVFADVFHWMEQIPPFWAYVALLLIAYGENVIPPIPGDIIVVYAGYLVGVGKLDFIIVVLLSTIGGAAGFMTMYAIGHKIGDAVMDKNRLRWLPKEKIERARRWLEHWGFWVVALNRFLSGARSIISLTVGMARIDSARTAACATGSALVWTSLIAYGGFELGDNWPVIGAYLRTYGTLVTVIGVTLTVGFGLRYYLKWRRSSRYGRSGRTPDGTSARANDQ